MPYLERGGEPAEEVDKWVMSINEKPNSDLLSKAQRAIDRILSKDSELLELWQERDESEAWMASMTQPFPLDCSSQAAEELPPLLCSANLWSLTNG